MPEETTTAEETQEAEGQEEEQEQGSDDDSEVETVEEQEEEAEGEQEEAEGEEDEEEEEELPIDERSPLMETIVSASQYDEDMEEQLKRVRKKNLRNLGPELQFSIFPMMNLLRSAIEGLTNWALEFESEQAEEEAEEAIAAGAEELKEVCEKILKLEEIGVRNQNLDELVMWAEEKLKQLAPPEEAKEAQDE